MSVPVRWGEIMAVLERAALDPRAHVEIAVGPCVYRVTGNPRRAAWRNDLVKFVVKLALSQRSGNMAVDTHVVTLAMRADGMTLAINDTVCLPVELKRTRAYDMMPSLLIGTEQESYMNVPLRRIVLD